MKDSFLITEWKISLTWISSIHFFLPECQVASETIDQVISVHDFKYLHDYTSVIKEQDSIHTDSDDQNTPSTIENDNTIISTD